MILSIILFLQGVVFPVAISIVLFVRITRALDRAESALTDLVKTLAPALDHKEREAKTVANLQKT